MKLDWREHVVAHIIVDRAWYGGDLDMQARIAGQAMERSRQSHGLAQVWPAYEIGHPVYWEVVVFDSRAALLEYGREREHEGAHLATARRP